MPIYRLCVFNSARLEDDRANLYYTTLSKLHAQTFNTDANAVRVEIDSEGPICKGGYGFKPARGVFGYNKHTNYIVAYVDFRGPAEVWQEHCRKITRAFPEFKSIYLQRLEYEFEFGGIIAAHEESAQSSTDAPPGYSDQLRE
ncbi:hypothetical protein BT63DRAFT_422987 [Microthyrium microscopicum]|uniref:Uncharacterized protein n=1 Tax=Microthyrium microscopicum TaxID=703497 RepID=A0A6A6ULI7_9PEZI|nr:hypothetical protein BT63DRAFT_422987 [Microthyrium microscopicum]